MLLGAGREAETLEDLEVGAAVEIPTRRAAVGLVAHAAVGGPARAVDDDLTGAGRPPMPVDLVPRGGDLARRFVTVVRLAPGSHAPIGEWADRHLAGLEVYDDLAPCTGGYLVGLAAGNDAAVFDPRPLLVPGHLAAHPYDMASLVVTRAAGRDRRGPARRARSTCPSTARPRWRGRATPTPRSPPACGPRPARSPTRPPERPRLTAQARRRSSAACSGATMLMSTPVPASNPATLVSRGSTCTCQWNRSVVAVRRGVEDEVVGGVADAARASAASESRTRPAHRHQVGRRGVGEVGLVGAGDDQHLVGGRRSRTGTRP